MAFASLPTEPIDFDTGIAPDRARRVAAALARRVVPLLRRIDGRVEPLASGVLLVARGRLLLLTCRHLFDGGVAVGDLLLPLPPSRRLLALAGAQARVLEHPQRDLAAIEIAAPAAQAALLRHWHALRDEADLLAASTLRARVPCVVAGWPYAQMRRHDGAVVARPVVFFAPPRAVGDGSADLPQLAYGRVARRVDGAWVHAPPLDGVSGAPVWAVLDGAAAAPAGCVLRPVGVQCSFRHDAYARAEPFAAFEELLSRARRS